MTTIGHVILDRDGVLNREPTSGCVADPGDWLWERGALEGLELLARSVVRVSIVTNQSCIGRGWCEALDVERVHTWLGDRLSEMGIDLVGVFTCPHAPADGCRCRKPAPGLVVDAIAASGIISDATALVGDDVRDIEAAAAAGISSVLVRTGKGRSAERYLGARARAFDDLHRAVAELLGGVAMGA